MIIAASVCDTLPSNVFTACGAAAAKCVSSSRTIREMCADNSVPPWLKIRGAPPGCDRARCSKSHARTTGSARTSMMPSLTARSTRFARVIARGSACSRGAFARMYAGVPNTLPACPETQHNGSSDATRSDVTSCTASGPATSPANIPLIPRPSPTARDGGRILPAEASRTASRAIAAAAA